MMKHNHNLSDMDTHGAYITGVMRKIANDSQPLLPAATYKQWLTRNMNRRKQWQQQQALPPQPQQQQTQWWQQMSPQYQQLWKGLSPQRQALVLQDVQQQQQRLSKLPQEQQKQYASEWAKQRQQRQHLQSMTPWQRAMATYGYKTLADFGWTKDNFDQKAFQQRHLRNPIHGYYDLRNQRDSHLKAEIQAIPESLRTDQQKAIARGMLPRDAKALFSKYNIDPKAQAVRKALFSSGGMNDPAVQGYITQRRQLDAQGYRDSWDMWKSSYGDAQQYFVEGMPQTFSPEYLNKQQQERLRAEAAEQQKRNASIQRDRAYFDSAVRANEIRAKAGIDEQDVDTSRTLNAANPLPQDGSPVPLVARKRTLLDAESLGHFKGQAGTRQLESIADNKGIDQNQRQIASRAVAGRKQRAAFQTSIRKNKIQDGVQVTATNKGTRKPWQAEVQQRRRYFADGTPYYAKTTIQSAEQARSNYGAQLIEHIQAANEAAGPSKSTYYSKGSVNEFLRQYKGGNPKNGPQGLVTAYKNWMGKQGPRTSAQQARFNAQQARYNAQQARSRNNQKVTLELTTGANGSPVSYKKPPVTTTAQRPAAPKPGYKGQPTVTRR